MESNSKADPLGARDGDVRRVTAPPSSYSYLRAARNLRGHWWRDARRVLVLVAADLATYGLLRTAVRALRDGALGGELGSLVSTIFAEGFLGGPQFAVALLLSLLIAGAYGAGEFRRDTGRVLYGAMLAAIISLYSAAWREQLLLVLGQFAATVAVVGSALAAGRKGIDALVRRVRRGRGAARTILVAHESANWTKLEEHIVDGSDLSLAGTLRLPDRADQDGQAMLSTLASLIERSGADTVLLWTDLSEDEFSYAVDVALVSGCRLLAGPRTPRRHGAQPRAVWVDGWPLVELTTPSLQLWQLAVKRGIDILGAIVGMVVLLPVLATIALWIRRDSAGPVLFRQTRLGRRGRRFRCFKFRTMRHDAEATLTGDPAMYARYVENNYKLPADDDPRVTASGRFLRKTSLDELPQLMNVLMGQMSLVGPRPIVPDEIQQYGGGAGLFLSLKPGMTGAWAVNGRSSVGYPDRVGMELEYIRSWSVLSDVTILLRTLPAVLRRRGVE